MLQEINPHIAKLSIRRLRLVDWGWLFDVGGRGCFIKVGFIIVGWLRMVSWGYLIEVGWLRLVDEVGYWGGLLRSVDWC